MPTTGRDAVPRVIVTPGEPAGIGPELSVRLATEPHDAELVFVADPELVEKSAARVGIRLDLGEYHPETPPAAGRSCLIPVSLATPSEPGRLDPANARYVLRTLDTAVNVCLRGGAEALVTGPVHKGVINDAGIPFTGHTDFLARRCGVEEVVMMLAADDLRVALVTTHLPLSEVPGEITPERLTSTLKITHRALTRDFGLECPRLLVLGLNPHAGEGGHLGREEIDVMAPVLETMRGRGMDIRGPVPADTAFTPDVRVWADAIVAMYHDQGLPALKQAGFGRAVNITLGLPIVRTSVDHGTGLDIAGKGKADPGSLREALARAVEIARRRAAASPRAAGSA